MKDGSVSFVEKYGIFVVVSVLAVALGGYAAYRVDNRNKEFKNTVKQQLMVSDGYDQQLIDMVRRLEDELAERASFGYAGRKDPMSGTTRIVAQRPVPQVRRDGSAKRPAAAAAPSVAVNVPEAVFVEAPDPVRLTAIIFDNAKKTYTAIVMDGSRSFSLAVGDRIAGRRITRITNEDIYMENETERFVYNIMGGSSRIQK
ncbi:MAG: hypothetical protein FWB85_05585 [Chitinispirillia bacterium]|nr:hypothetical protein [Chitinispirillia bacterium]MCL2241704.1 hypothetical protein [Chitinispirillia bacterium]